jgi:hypothetical protein
MTLKCKIKEITELKTKEEVDEYPKEEAFDPKQIHIEEDQDSDDDVGLSEEEFQL